MRHATIALSLAVSLAFPSFAQETATTEVAEYDASTVVARVNAHEITVGHMIAIMERLPEQYQTLADEQLYSGILDQLIDQAIIADTVSKMAETDSKRVQLILENERLALLSKNAVDALAEEGVDEAAVQDLYDAQYGNTDPQVEYNASHILVETAEAAQEAITAITDGAEFADVAKEKSTGPSGPNGGELGWFGEGVMVPEFQAAVMGMEAGAVSEPVQTQFGWHVIKLNEVRDVPPPALEEVRAELEEGLLRQKIETTIDGMRAEATIERVEIAIPASSVRASELLDAE